MRYEECSRALVRELAGRVDPSREGTVIDVGVGTANDYFMDSAKQGFRTLAVEPLPTPGLPAMCRMHGVELEVACISDVDGHVRIYVGEFGGAANSNLSSLDPAWWGSGKQVRRVPSLKLSSLLMKYGISRITVLKLDIEGSEATIIRGLEQIPRRALPSIIQFEYGGGGTRQSQLGGWSPGYLARTCESVEMLKSLGYEDLILVDRALPLVRAFRLQEIARPEAIFDPLSHVGNAIVYSDSPTEERLDVDAVCSPYADYPRSLVDELLRFGSGGSEHSFRWVLPYVIADQYETKRRSLRILEYGPGCNTKQFVRSQVCERLVSVEDNPEWYAEHAAVFEAPEVATDYRLVEVKSREGRAYAGGHCWSEEEILSFVEYPLKYGAGYFDIVFIDPGDRQDQVTIRGRAYSGWPIRNLCLELAHSFLGDRGVAVVHDVPGPFAAMNHALADSLRGFRCSESFWEFSTTILSDSLDLGRMRERITRRYRLGLGTRLLARLSCQGRRSWYSIRIAKLLMTNWMGLS